MRNAIVLALITHCSIIYAYDRHMIEPMNIVHVTQSAGSAGGGVAKYIWDLSAWLTGQNICTQVVACDINGVHSNANAHILARKWPNFLGRTRIAHWLDALQTKPTLIHIHGLRCYHNAQACTWAIKNRVPVLVSPHAQLMPWTMKRNAMRKLVYDTVVERPLLARASAIHFVSEVERCESVYSELFAGKFSVVPIGLNRAQWNDLVAQPIDALKDPCPLIAFFGWLSYRKGVDILIDALPEIVRAQPNARLVIAGADPENIRPDLQMRAEQLRVHHNITWLTDITRPQARWLVERAECFVLPSRAESFSIAILEALSLGTPVVASRESTWDQLSQQGFGCNCQLNAPSVAQCVLSLLTLNQAQRQEQRQSIAAQIQISHTWDRCGKDMLDVYRRLMDDCTK